MRAQRPPRIEPALVVISGGDRVVGELGEIEPRALDLQLFERRDDERMQPQATGAREPLVERVANQHVLEAKTAGRAGDVGHYACVDRLIEDCEQPLLRKVA